MREESIARGRALLTVPRCSSGEETMIDLNQENMLGSANQGWKEVQEGTFVTG